MAEHGEWERKGGRHLREGNSGGDQRGMSEALREIAQHLVAPGIVLFREEIKVIAC